jgi:hypothetical protein
MRLSLINITKINLINVCYIPHKFIFPPIDSFSFIDVAQSALRSFLFQYSLWLLLLAFYCSDIVGAFTVI